MSQEAAVNPYTAPESEPADPPLQTPRTQPSLKKNVSWTLLGYVVFMASRFGVILMIAWLADKSTVGIYTLAVSICAPVFEFAKLNLRAVQATDAKNEFSFSICFALRIVTTATAAAAIPILCLYWDLTPLQMWTAIGLGALTVVDLMADVVYGLLQRLEAMSRVSASQMLHGVARVTLLTGALVAGANLPTSVFCAAAAAAAVLLLWDVGSLLWALHNETDSAEAVAWRPQWSIGPMQRLFFAALPLGIINFCDQLILHLPRLQLEKNAGDAVLGAYGVCSLFLSAGFVVIVALADSVRPRMARYFLVDRRRFGKLWLGTVAVAGLVGAVGVAGAWLLGEWVLRLAFPAEYADHADLLFWMSITAAVWYLSGITHTTVLSTRRFKSQLPVVLVAAPLAYWLSTVWIPQHEALGAAWASTIGYAVRLVGAAILVCWFATSSPVEDASASEQASLEA